MAYDLGTGAAAWTMYNVGPNADVGIGARFQKTYPYLAGANPAQDSWFGDSWQRGGGNVASPFTYDAELNLVFHATGACRPGNPDYRRERGRVELNAAGQLTAFHNNFCAAQMARDPRTGELVWAYTLTPQDMWSLDEQGATPLIDLDGAKAAVRASANGLFYAWDRATGRLLSAPWMHTFQDVIKGPAFVDMATGLPAYDVDKVAFTALADRRRYTQADPAGERRPADYTGTEVAACPAGGTRRWEADAYSPRTKLVYAHTTNACAATVAVAGDYRAGEPYLLLRRANFASVVRRDLGGQPTTTQSELKALDAATRKVAWARPMGDETRTGQLVTAGDVLFKGDNASGNVVALDARSGEPLWSFRSGSGFSQSPITYLQDGRQYVAIVASSASLNTPIGFNLAPDAAARQRRGGTTLYVFAPPQM
jgi:glucose dehydrogenase